MGTLEIIKRNGEKIRLFSKEPFCTLKSAAQNSSLMGDDNVQLSIVSSELLNLGKGDKIIVEGEEYTIRTKVNREMLSDNHYVHDATFYGDVRADEKPVSKHRCKREIQQKHV